MEEKFAITISQHRRFGYILLPYWIVKNSEKEFYTVRERIIAADLSEDNQILNEIQVKIVNLSEEYSDTTIVKLFSKNKKLSTKDFINQLDDAFISERIRPYIEKRIAKIIHLAISQQINLYHKLQLNNLHESDHIQYDGELSKTIFNFIKVEDGIKYFLTIKKGDEELSLTNKPVIVLSNDPCILVIENRLFMFEDIDSRKLQPFITKEYVFIPKSAEKKYYKTFILPTLGKYQVNSKGLNITRIEETPTPVLSFEEDLTQRAVFHLKFAYPGIRWLSASKTGDTSVSFNEEDDHFMVVKRDLAYENSKKVFLKMHGLVSKDDVFFYVISNEEDNYDHLMNAVIWLNRHSNHLTQERFIVDQTKSRKNFYKNHVDLQLKVDDYNDWFDVRAYIHLKDSRIPFVALRHHIMKGIREYELPNGKVFVIPSEWFAQYRDFFVFANDNEEKLTFKKQHYTLLQKTIEGIDKKKFGSLTSVDFKDALKEVPEGLKAILRPYQHEGYTWMHQLQKNKFGVCLADDMGLGKTLQTLTLLKEEINNTKPALIKPRKAVVKQLSLFGDAEDEGEKENETFKKTSLVITPTSLVHNWMNEMNKFVPDLSVYNYTGMNRGDFTDVYGSTDVIITSYGIVRNEIEKLRSHQFFYIVLDESQVIKNHESKAYQAVVQLLADHRIILTGTPIENSLSDLWSQMNFINPGLLGNYHFFKNEFIYPVENKSDDEKEAKLKQLISPFILRRTKQEVEKDLPELSEHAVYCDMTDDQLKIYEEEKSKVRNLIVENLAREGYNKSSIIILQALTRLRQISNHPVLIDEKYQGESGKFEDIVRKMENIRSEGHKTLVFSSFVKHLNMYADYFDKHGFKYSMLTGSTQNREEAVERFQYDPEVNFFLISLKAGGTGLNLTAAEYVFLIDPWWNPASEMQAIARAHRIGQKNKVFVYRFISSETIEEKIIRLQTKKSKLADTFVNENNPFKTFSEEEMMGLLE
jgi:SNF2 family DNA or RNA helicase